MAMVNGPTTSVIHWQRELRRDRQRQRLKTSRIADNQIVRKHLLDPRPRLIMFVQRMGRSEVKLWISDNRRKTSERCMGSWSFVHELQEGKSQEDEEERKREGQEVVEQGERVWCTRSVQREIPHIRVYELRVSLGNHCTNTPI